MTYNGTFVVRICSQYTPPVAGQLALWSLGLLLLGSNLGLDIDVRSGSEQLSCWSAQLAE